ncbi:asparaginase [Catenuloplanes atrovinosus]|uniref:L-asparaginase II n=1 Tax=Catenuloplanes atrovinosus TaxID=137266 RepID=A0AAE4C7T0_9ACTN|nr:asparaginase [Catenuloplanes atrovinosus]MDR7274213.1 L-asparaginase II [Catenuloplanes atrovinosus]
MRDGYRGGAVLAEVVRSGFTESVHRGSVVVLDAGGAPVAVRGDGRGPVFPRSSNKPLQGVGMLRAGLRLEAESDLALVCASHWGEDVHVSRVEALLDAHGFAGADLRCPPDLPAGPVPREAALRAGEAPTRTRMNCSGKHTGMLLTCRAAGWSTDAYWDPAHPLQRMLRATAEELTGEPVAAVGVDGCGAPVFAFSLTGVAQAFLRLVHAAPGSFERQVADAMRAHPRMVAGTGALDTVIMTEVPRLLAKGGAEGFAAVAVPGAGAIALKIDDGNPRAIPAVLRAALGTLGVDWTAPPSPVLGGGETVGELSATW